MIQFRDPDHYKPGDSVGEPCCRFVVSLAGRGGTAVFRDPAAFLARLFFAHLAQDNVHTQDVIRFDRLQCGFHIVFM